MWPASAWYAAVRSCPVVAISALHSIWSDTMRFFADPVTWMVRSGGRVLTRFQDPAARNVATITATAMNSPAAARPVSRTTGVPSFAMLPSSYGFVPVTFTAYP